MVLLKPVPISVITFLVLSYIFSFFSPEVLQGFINTKVGQAVVENSNYSRLQVSMFFGSIFSIFFMAPYLLVVSNNNKVSDCRFLPGDISYEMMGLGLFIIAGLNQFLFFDRDSYLGHLVVNNPVMYFVFIILPILLYQLLFRYFFTERVTVR